tara:strand:- start:84 stop:623 length:540 start_codon:yes stop_codon:yes gene_type:complete
MKFIDNNILDYQGKEFNVLKNNGVATMKFNDNTYLTNTESYTKLFLGNCNKCNSFYKEFFDNFQFDTVLVAGLGLGLIPQELIEVNKCSKVDCLEISQEMIDYTHNSGHLNKNINIIQGDIYNYNTLDMYDLIIIDIIWQEYNMSNNQWNSLVSHYDKNLNINGAIFAPVKKKSYFKIN